MNRQAERLARKIKAADIQRLKTSEKTDTDPADPYEIALSVIQGDIDAKDVRRRLLVWVNDSVDVPYIPEVLEEKALRLVVEALEGAVISFIKKQLR